MNKIFKFLLSLVAAISGFVFGNSFGSILFIGTFRLIEFFSHTSFEAGWMLILLASFSVGLAAGCICAFFFALISWGKFGSETWKINRYVLTIVIPLVACGGLYAYNSISQIKEKDKCLNMPAGIERDRCLSTAARPGGDNNACAQIQDKNERVQCYYYNNVDYSDSKRCDSVQGLEEKDSCYSAIGHKTHQMSDCEKISKVNDREFCYSQAAKDVSDCQKITDFYKRSSCYLTIAVLKNDYTYCARNENQERTDYCYRDFVANRHNLEVCNLISDVNIRKSCN